VRLNSASELYLYCSHVLGQKIVTTFPTTLNSPPSTGGGSTGQRTGIIAGVAIGASLLALLFISAVFVFYRRRRRHHKISLAHRALPTPRSALLADEDAFDLDAPPRPMGEGGAPQLLRPRGLETGSIFHEGVWPPPSERSRLEDPLLAGSAVNLTSIVSDVMGEGDHGRSISTDTTQSDVPLLANMPSERNGDQSYAALSSSPSHVTSRPTPASRSPLALMSDLSEATPLNPSGHDRQLSDDTSPGSPRSEGHPLPPGAALPVVRGKSGRSVTSVSTTGSPSSDFLHARGGPSGFGSLMVVNGAPDAEQEPPLVDLAPIAEDPLHEIPPLYHTIHRTASDTWDPTSDGRQLLNRDARPSPLAEGSTPSGPRGQWPSSSNF
jgi:hypothetical protein